MEIADSIMDFRQNPSQPRVDFLPFLDSDMQIITPVPTLPELKDSITILQAMTGQNPSEIPELDIDSDGKTGLPESVFTLEYLAQLRKAIAPTKELFTNGIVVADMTLTTQDSPYLITKNVRVAPGVILTIEPGVRLEFLNNSRLTVEGRLEAVGMPANPITFKFYNDWSSYIHFLEGSGNLAYSNLEGGGIYCSSTSSLSIRNNSIQSELSFGIFITACSSLEIINNNINNGEKGIYCRWAVDCLIENNTIQNSLYGIYLYKSLRNQIIGNTVSNSDSGIYTGDYIQGNVIKDNNLQGKGIELDESYGIHCADGSSIMNNTITGFNVGIHVDRGNPTIHHNSIYDNIVYNITLSDNYDDPSSVTIDASCNWWGTTELIENGIRDYADDPNLAHLNYQPFLDGQGGNTGTGDIKICIYAAPIFIEPALGEQSTISYNLNFPANVTIDLYQVNLTIGSQGGGTYNRVEPAAMRLVDDQSREAGANTEIWNGKDSNGNVLEHSAYIYAISATHPKYKDALYDPEYVSGTVSLKNLSITPAEYNPYANATITISYTLFKPAWVTIGGREGASGTVTMQGFMLEAAPRNQGDNSEIWDGLDGFGKVFTDKTEVALKAEILPENVIVLQDTTLKIIDASAEAFVIIPAYNEISTIKYTLSKSATVSATVSDPNGNIWTILNPETQSAGPHEIEWHGVNGDGKLVWPQTDASPEGDYMIEITATDTANNSVVKRRMNVHVYR